MPVEITVDDEQQAHPIDEGSVRALAEVALEAEGVRGPAELTLRFVDEEAIAALNVSYLGHEGPTDVLSFPIEDDPRQATGADEPPVLLGDVVICPAVAARNAPEHAGDYESEIALLVVHGILHLLGMDHELDDEAEAMESRERAILASARGDRR